MAIKAVGLVVGFIGMFLIHLSPVVAEEAVRRTGAVIGMAGSAAPVGSAVVHREAVGEISRGPGAGVVALRALAREVVGRLLPAWQDWQSVAPAAAWLKVAWFQAVVLWHCEH